MQLDDSVHFAEQIGGFAIPDQLDLRDVGFTSGSMTVSFTEAGGSTSGTLIIETGKAKPGHPP